LFVHVPSAFIPEEDQGYFISLIQAPEGVSLNYTSDVMKRVEKQLLALPETLGTFAIGGFGFSGNAANSGVIFTTLHPWSQRRGEAHTSAGLITKMRKQLSSIQEAVIVPFNPPAIQGLSNFGGFQFELEDRGTNTINSLAETMGALLKQGNATPGLQGLLSTFRANTPQLTIEVDRDKAESLGVPLDQIFNTLQSFLGSRYVNDFNQFQRTYRVYVQADTQYRSNPEDINRIYVRSAQNQMIPLGNLVKITSTTAPQTITHYNLNRSIEINGSPSPGTSSGQALQIMENLAAKVLPSSMTYEWSGTSLEEKTSGGQAPFIFGLGIVFVFLVLAAQYESLYDPFVILLAVPLGILGALLSLSLRGLPDDVYSQIGLVMLIGLASKNAILIVEFANQLLEQGYTITKAAIEASSERLRPILMTSFAFMLGIFPLVIAEGAGAASRISLGTAVLGGMLLSTFLSLFVVPILYILITSLRDRLSGRNRKPKVESTPQPEPELEEARR
jgi:hydrophobic/amphiphilic exporter-1 (mainly G- bacteria), HAE1 family